MDALMDYGMCLDIPAWVARSPAGQKATGISTYAEAVQGTYINNDWFINRYVEDVWTDNIVFSIGVFAV